MAGQVADKPAVFVDLLGAGAVGNAGRLDNGKVGRLALGGKAGHDIHQRDKPMVMNRNLPPGRAVHDVAHWAFVGLFRDLDL